jgi:SAM-dependent methyltransferase
MSEGSLIGEVERYYSDKVSRFGPTPQGVDWNGPSGQALRFERLLAVIADKDAPTSVIDYGCGYGSLCDLLEARDQTIDYTGYDVSKAMIRAAREGHPERPGIRFVQERAALSVADYTVASGIFNVRQRRDESEWTAYVLRTIADMVAVSRHGLAFNALTAHSDAEFKRSDLHYADPAALLDHCLRRYSRNVVLDHDYDLYEFTLIVRLDGRGPASYERGEFK